MLVSDFQAKYICCVEGKAEGLKYETMKEWWETTDRGDWMRWAWYVDCRNRFGTPRMVLQVRGSQITVDYPDV